MDNSREVAGIGWEVICALPNDVNRYFKTVRVGERKRGVGFEQNEVEGLAEVLKERKSHRKKASFFHSPPLPTSPSQFQTLSTPQYD